MDAQLPTSDLTRELDELRRRAYGPDGDIAEDPMAAARLRELEDVMRTHDPVEPQSSTSTGGSVSRTPRAHVGVVDSAETRSPSVATPTPAADPDAVGDVAPSGDAANQHGNDGMADTTVSRLARRRKRSLIALMVAGAAVVGIVIGWAATNASGPHPAATLSVADTDPAMLDGRTDLRNFMAAWDISPTSIVQFAHYGQLELWGAKTKSGEECLIVTDPDTGVVYRGLNCTPQGLPQIVDVQASSESRSLLPASVKPGEMARLQREGNQVTVWLAPPEPTTS